MKLIIRLLPVLAALTLTAGAQGTAYASTGSGAQWRDYAGSYVNAWGGGPAINVYNAQALNNDFALIADPHGSGYYELELETGGHSAYDGQCIGDYGGSSGSARAGMVSCGSAGSAPGYGALFSPVASGQGCNSGDFALKNRHWPGGWLGPTGAVNGDAFYLNNSASVCYHTIGAY